MNILGYERDPDMADCLPLIRMSDHDRALARKYMDEGALIADVLLCALSGARTLIGNTGKLLSGLRLHSRV